MKNFKMLAFVLFFLVINQTSTTLATQKSDSKPTPEQIEEFEARFRKIGEKLHEMGKPTPRNDNLNLAIGAGFVGLSAIFLYSDVSFARMGAGHVADGLKELRSNKNLLSTITRSPITRQALRSVGFAGIPCVIGSFLIYSSISSMPRDGASLISDTSKLMAEIKKQKAAHSTNA